MTSTHSRRSFLGRGAATGLGIAFAGSIDAIAIAIAGTAAHAATRTAIQSEPGRVFAITGPWGRPSNAR